MTATSCKTVQLSLDGFLTGSLAPNRNASALGHLGCARCYAAHAPSLPASHETVTDLGCGIDSDTNALRALGHRAQPVDHLAPSTNFARWRFRQRGHNDDYYIRRTAGEIDRTIAFYGLNPGPTAASDSPVKSRMRAPKPGMLTRNAAGSRT